MFIVFIYLKVAYYFCLGRLSEKIHINLKFDKCIIEATPKKIEFNDASSALIKKLIQ
jgi:hypothetical protein